MHPQATAVALVTAAAHEDHDLAAALVAEAVEEATVAALVGLAAGLALKVAEREGVPVATLLGQLGRAAAGAG